MTTNGTFINGIELEVEQAYQISDGDEIKMGNTVFKFKTSE
jgi:pSer/pThr/pTyr-binding forkhead associated (FHA) protein